MTAGFIEHWKSIKLLYELFLHFVETDLSVKCVPYFEIKNLASLAGVGRAAEVTATLIIIIIIIIIMNFYSPVSNTRCHSIGHKMRIARIKIRVDSPGRWERA